MNFKIVLLSVFLSCFFALSATAQVKEPQKDSTAIYKEIQTYAKTSKFKKFVYKLIFRSSALETKKKAADKPEKSIITKKTNGKIVRNIIIETLDPIGYSVNDIKRVPRNRFERFGNSMHNKTKAFVIKKLLLVEENGICDSILLKESERLIRSQRFVREVSVTPIYLDSKNDSIDIKIRVLDSWSLVPDGTISNTKSKIKIIERNIFGFGHQLSGEVGNKFSPSEHDYNFKYSVPNIINTYIRFDLEYEKEFNDDSKRKVSLNRPFYSVFTKDAGGISFENTVYTEAIPILDSLVNSVTKYEIQDYWYGHAFKITNPSWRETKYINLVAAVSFNRKAYLTSPGAILDPTNFFASEKNSIGYIGLSRQKYYQDNYIFNFNITEDVPYGEKISLVFGHQQKNSGSRFYSGITLAQGKRYSFGYLSAFTEWGSFYNHGITEQTAFKVGASYFSPLRHIGTWRVRHFIKPTYIWGNNRDESFKDQLRLNDYYGIEGFDSQAYGTQKWVVSLQTQSYMPGNWNGFRFSPYINITAGSLAARNAFFDSKVYSKFTLGIQINNDYLVFSSFQISFSYYPTIPFEGDNIFKTNNFSNDDFIIEDYMLGKPQYIRYE